MKRPPRRKKPPTARERAAETEPMSRAEKLKLWAFFLGMAAALFLVFHFIATAQQRSALDDLVTKWKRDYHLSEEQARRIRTMEEKFHGSGNPFLRPAHDAAETTAHHWEMASVMNPEDGERFIFVMEGRGAGSPRKR